MRPFPLFTTAETALCFTSNFILSHIIQRRAHLCSNPIHNSPTTSIEPLFLFSDASCHTTTLNILSASTIKNDRSTSLPVIAIHAIPSSLPAKTIKNQRDHSTTTATLPARTSFPASLYHSSFFLIF